jgi:hypothetical protein
MKSVVLIFFSLIYLNIFGQNNRLNISDEIGWFSCFITPRIDEKISVHAEYQWRRSDWGRVWQQSLLRTGVNFNLNERVQFRGGYGWIETFNYGEIPINIYGKVFSEHRAFQMAQIKHHEGLLIFSHRFMLEQRWTGKYSNSLMLKEDSYVFTNRLRYMVRIQLPLQKLGNSNKSSKYLAAYNEVFIGFGKNVHANIFDQNRVGIVFGYNVNKHLKIEAGVMNQTLEFGRVVDGQNIFQHNNGIIINAFFDFDVLNRKQNTAS